LIHDLLVTLLLFISVFYKTNSGLPLIFPALSGRAELLSIIAKSGNEIFKDLKVFEEAHLRR
jgi:hypothetical protein